MSNNYQHRLAFHNLLRGTERYQEWRQDVFESVGKQCELCGDRQHLHIHHVTPFANIVNRFLDQYADYEIPGEEGILLEFAEMDLDLWDIENGRVLCEFCHELEHL